MQLGRLRRIELRDIWQTEAQHFTPWLASDENIEMLSETLGMDLEVEAQEKQVGPFRADILCKDAYSDSWVLIENQLEKTDHRHLGQLMTYAAGLQAVTIVWVAAEFNDEHRAALDWLNRITDAEFRFFGLEVEVWKIGDSQAAPKFNIVSKPNEWSRQTNRAAARLSTENVTATKLQQLDFWEQFSKSLSDHSHLKTQTPRPQHWLVITIGKGGMNLGGLINSRAKTIGIELYIRDAANNDIYQNLWTQRDAIEAEIGCALNWMELPDKRASRIVLNKQDCDLSEENRWDEYVDWMKETLIKFDSAFRKRVQAL